MLIVSRAGIVATAMGLSVLFGWRTSIGAEGPSIRNNLCGTIAQPIGISIDPVNQSAAPDLKEEPSSADRAVTCFSSTAITTVTLDLVLLADYSTFYTEAGAYDRAIQIFKLVQATYSSTTFTKPVGMRLNRIYQFVGSDPFSASTDPATLVTSIHAWKAANAANPGVAALMGFTARSLDAGSNGLSYQSSFCNSFNVGFVSESAGVNTPYVRAITSHMIGHIGGMSHDSVGNGCPATGFIMSSSITPVSPPAAFSSCSIASWNSYILSGPSCLNQAGPSLGDLNCDCLVNVADVDALVLALLDPAAYSANFPSCTLTQCDLNGDGSVNGKDIRCLESVLVP